MSRSAANSDPELAHRLSRRGMLGVAAGATAAGLIGAAAGPACAAAPMTSQATAPGRGRRKHQ
ncbi:hypothetical protein FBY35_1282 [Streptomyces sp. SLBN-118]|uniref:hypothetical protein n=1 Tax=Streptomyces sp. SLBN-118 TaxID=2768454 RepID=UPI00116E4585|nr:hypothetical protein FBY35_1282 [Streptomyces sp. SLBN-118]